VPLPVAGAANGCLRSTFTNLALYAEIGRTYLIIQIVLIIVSNLSCIVSNFSLCTAVALDETRERTFVSWMHNRCSGNEDSSQIWGPASDWTALYLNNL
jgi:hypothetical protein